MKQALSARVEVFLQEFPFLRNHIQVNRLVQRPTVQRMDLGLMDKTGWTSGWAFSHRYYLSRYCSAAVRYILFGKNGFELGEVRPSDMSLVARTDWRRFLGLKHWVSTSGETVIEAIQKLPNQNDFGYILELNDDYLWSETGPRSGTGLTAILHKLPSDKSLSDLLVHVREVAADELKGELTTVNQI